MKSFGLTDIGTKRKFNQDYTIESDKPVGNLDNLYIACDGLGGRNAGEYASLTAAEGFFEAVENSDSRMPLSIFREACRKINEKIYTEGQIPKFSGMATTIVAATVRDDTVYVVNVGDSRAYIIGDEVTQITWDHPYVGELVRSGKITRDEARFHSKNNVITKAIGAESVVEPDYFQARLDEGEVILLCTDGLYNMVDEETIRKTALSKGSLKSRVNRLIALANEAGGRDNIGVVLISE